VVEGVRHGPVQTDVRVLRTPGKGVETVAWAVSGRGINRLTMIPQYR
jgi:hypothetical protein